MTSRSRIGFFLFCLLAVSGAALVAQAPKKPAIAYPTGYRQWTHVKSMVIFSNQHPLFEKFGGLHNVYVNTVGWPAHQKGTAYPDGSVFVFDLFDIRTGTGAIETKGRKFVAVMKKNSKAYAPTGGWGWEVFQGYEQAGSLKDAKACFDCHASQQRADYVFSTYVE